MLHGFHFHRKHHSQTKPDNCHTLLHLIDELSLYAHGIPVNKQLYIHDLGNIKFHGYKILMQYTIVLYAT